MSCLDDRARVFLTVQASRRTATPEEGRRAVADALPEPLAAALSPDDLTTWTRSEIDCRSFLTRRTGRA
jgi:hypothetical protein